MQGRVFGLALAVVAVGGCTSLLGDFGVSDAPGADAGLDTSTSVTDAARDQEAGFVAPEAGSDALAGCATDEKACGGNCVKLSEPAYGCADTTTCAPCAVPNAAATCAAGACAIGSCNSGWDDCKNGAADGCEAHVAVDPANCGKCLNACNASGGAPNCGGGTCSSIACTPPNADCNSKPADGCEVDTSSTVTSCGACDHVCGATNGTPACTDSKCVFQCAAPFKHCPTSKDADGCDIETSSDNANCGDCGVVCGTGTHCVSGRCACDATSCASGCCAGTTCQAHALTTCGIAGSACIDCGGRIQNAGGATCSASGACAYAACNPGYLDADGDPTNGCESLSPTSVAESSSMLLWLVADDFAPTTGNWPNHLTSANANTCSGAVCPSVIAGPKGHNAAVFSGGQQINLGGNYQDWSGVTIVMVWNPASNPDYAPLITFSNPQYANKARVQINQGGSGAWVFQICDLTSNCPFLGNGIFTSGWHRTFAIDAAGQATAFDEGSAAGAAAIPLPPSAPRTISLLGADLFNRFFQGQIAEVIVFKAAISPTSRGQIDAYLKNKYGI